MKRVTLLVFCTFLCCLYQRDVTAISVVYNLRIAETTKRQALAQKTDKNYIVGAGVGIEQWRKRKDGAHQEISAGLGTLMYLPAPFYIRADFAVGRVRERILLLDNKKFERTQTDDVLFSAGYSHKLGKRSRITVSGLLGIPTHKDTGFQGIQFGTGHVGIGTQLDAALFYSEEDPNNAFMGAARLVHFFKRTVDIKLPTFNIDQRFDFGLGNVADILVAHTSKWDKHTTEVGYNATFGFGASLWPEIIEILDRIDFIRSSFYANYKYQFKIFDKLPSACAVGISYSFDHKPKVVGFKYSITLWGSWGFTF